MELQIRIGREGKVLINMTFIQKKTTFHFVNYCSFDILSQDLYSLSQGFFSLGADNFGLSLEPDLPFPVLCFAAVGSVAAAPTPFADLVAVAAEVGGNICEETMTGEIIPPYISD